MKIAIGLPNAVAGTTGKQIIDFSRRAEERGFSSLGTIDRIVYDNYDPFSALAAAAAATERIGLATTVAIAPPHGNDVLLAKRALTVQALSGGRLMLGMGLGGRDDDYEASGRVRPRGRASSSRRSSRPCRRSSPATSSASRAPSGRARRTRLRS